MTNSISSLYSFCIKFYESLKFWICNSRFSYSIEFCVVLLTFLLYDGHQICFLYKFAFLVNEFKWWRRNRSSKIFFNAIFTFSILWCCWWWCEMLKEIKINIQKLTFYETFWNESFCHLMKSVKLLSVQRILKEAFNNVNIDVGWRFW